MTDQRSSTSQPGLAQRLTDAAEVIERIAPDTPALVQLAQAWNGFYVVRT